MTAHSALAVSAMLAFGLWLSLAGCTITRTLDTEGQPTSVSLTLGPAALPEPGGNPVSVRVRGFGLAWGHGQGAAGYYSLRFGRVTGPCGAIFELPDAAAVAGARRLLPNRSRTLLMEH